METGARPIDARVSTWQATIPAATLSAASRDAIGVRQSFITAKAATESALAAPTPSENGTSSKPTSAAPCSAAVSAPWLAATPKPRMAPGPIRLTPPRQRAKTTTAQTDVATAISNETGTTSAVRSSRTGKLNATNGCDQTPRPSATPRATTRAVGSAGAPGQRATRSKIRTQATRQTANETAVGASPATSGGAVFTLVSTTLRWTNPFRASH